MASRRLPRGDFYDYLDFLSPDGRHRKGSAKSMQCGNLSLLIQRRFSLLEREHRLVGWHREAGYVLSCISLHSIPLLPPPQLQLFSLLTFYFSLFRFYSFPFPLHIFVHSLRRGSLYGRDTEERSLSTVYFRLSLPPSIRRLLY